jgi:hypothetical protein
MILEDANVVGDKTFASYGNPKKEDIPLLEKNLAQLVQDGYGKKKPRKKKIGKKK